MRRQTMIPVTILALIFSLWGATRGAAVDPELLARFEPLDDTDKAQTLFAVLYGEEWQTQWEAVHDGIDLENVTKYLGRVLEGDGFLVVNSISRHLNEFLWYVFAADEELLRRWITRESARIALGSNEAQPVNHSVRRL